MLIITLSMHLQFRANASVYSSSIFNAPVQTSTTSMPATTNLNSQVDEATLSVTEAQNDTSTSITSQWTNVSSIPENLAPIETHITEKVPRKRVYSSDEKEELSMETPKPNLNKKHKKKRESETLDDDNNKNVRDLEVNVDDLNESIKNAMKENQKEKHPHQQKKN